MIVNSPESYSDADGFLSIFVKLLSISTEKFINNIARGQIAINIDGHFIYSTMINLYVTNGYATCQALKLIDSPDIKNETEYKQLVQQTFTKSITVQAIDNIGLPVKGVTLTFIPETNSYISLSNPPSSHDFMKLGTDPSLYQSTTDSQGYATFSSIRVII